MSELSEDDRAAPGPAEPSTVRLIATLAFAGLISGIAIIGIYQTTLPTITANKARELREAVFEVLPGATQLQKLVVQQGELIATNESSKGEEPIYGGYDDGGQFVGYAVPAEGPGFQDTIQLIYGYLADRERIVGMRVLDSRETPGLGDKIIKDADFVANFDDLAVVPEIVAVKKGQKSAPNEIDAITGATISSKSVVKIINASNAQWLSRLPPVGEEPERIPEDSSNGEPGKAQRAM